MNKVYFFLLLLLYSLAFAFDIQKPETYDDDNVTGWMMSEKLDGIRGYWDGESLYSKNGNKLHPPKWFTKNFPPFPLDGELWSKRDDFEFIQSIVLDSTPKDGWKNITYNVFEVPNAKGDFIERLKKVKEWFKTHKNPHVNIIEQIECVNEANLMEFLEKVVTLKGEGVIVKDPSQPYHTGRSPHILKVKKVYDMEGIVTGHNLRDNGTLKSLVVKLENGVIFNLGGGFSDEQRENYPKLGEMVTFKYYGFTKNGKPKFASFLRIREKE
jgi:DNA ligase-1